MDFINELIKYKFKSKYKTVIIDIFYNIDLDRLDEMEFDENVIDDLNFVLYKFGEIDQEKKGKYSLQLYRICTILHKNISLKLPRYMLKILKNK
jgi:hypothetical protein